MRAIKLQMDNVKENTALNNKDKNQKRINTYEINTDNLFNHKVSCLASNVYILIFFVILISLITFFTNGVLDAAIT